MEFSFGDVVLMFQERLKEGREINRTLLAGEEEPFPGQQGGRNATVEVRQRLADAVMEVRENRWRPEPLSNGDTGNM